MAKKAPKARRKEPQAAAPVQLAYAREQNVEAREQEESVDSSPAVLSSHTDLSVSTLADTASEAERPSQAPIMTPPSAEALAAHDSFVRSPAAVVESLGIRMTSAVARRLASIPPPPAAAPQEG